MRMTQSSRTCLPLLALLCLSLSTASASRGALSQQRVTHSSWGATDFESSRAEYYGSKQQRRELALGEGVAQVLSHETDKRSKKSGSKGSKKSSYSSSSSKKGGKGGKGSSKGDNIFSHKSSGSSKSGGGGSSGDDDDQLPNDGRPTPSPDGTPTLPTRPTPSPDTPTQPTPAPGPGRDPTDGGGSPTDGFPEPKCSVSSEGLFGSQLGLAEETEYFYQATVVPSVTAAELNLDILGRVEDLMAGFVLSGLFARCSDIEAQPSKRLRRVLQDAGNIEGWDLRPRDTVVEGGM